jgi:DNA-binding response OmpR family regulator
MRVLYITSRSRTGGWLAESFANERGADIELQEALGSTAGLARLRDEAYDAVLVSHEPGELDAMDLIRGYRAGGADEPIVVLGVPSEQEMAALCFEAGADGYVCANTTTTRNLVWIVARAVQRHRLIRENNHLNEAERQRLQRERDEAEKLLGQQRTLIANVESIRRAGSPLELPGELVHVYRELLRTYVIMGSGNLAGDLLRLAEMLATAGVSTRQAMELHLHVLEELVHGLGARSTRHVMTRADLLVLEIMIYLGEGYRGRYLEQAQPPVQRMLPGFDQAAPEAF